VHEGRRCDHDDQSDIFCLVRGAFIAAWAQASAQKQQTRARRLRASSMPRGREVDQGSRQAKTAGGGTVGTRSWRSVPKLALVSVSASSNRASGGSG